MSALCSRHIRPAAAAGLAFLLFLRASPAPAMCGAGAWVPGTVRGRVTNASTGEALGSVNVYLSYTLVGASTDTNGRYGLSVNEPAAYEMVFSLVGFLPRKQQVSIGPGDSLLVDVALEPTLIETGTVEVTSTPDLEWEKDLREFSRAFIGHSGFADECRIVNPEVIRFDRTGDTLVARSGRLIIVDNLALGYRVRIVLGEFLWNLTRDDGRFLVYPWFEEMRPEDPGEPARWRANRESAFNGSPRHFFRSLVAGATEAGRFRMYSGPLQRLIEGQGHRVTDGDFEVERREGDPAFAVRFPGTVRIEYGEVPPDVMGPRDRPGQPYYSNRTQGPAPRVSLVRMTGSAVIVDSTGNLFDPLSVEVAGDWASHRIESLLPRN